MRVSPRVRGTIEPPIVVFKDRLDALLTGGEGRPLIDLTQAVPSHAPPPVLADALAGAAADPAAMKYTPDAGLPAARTAVAGYLTRRHGADVEPDEVLLTPGANAAFHLLAHLFVEPRERVFVLSPYYFNHVMSIELLGGMVEEVRLPLGVATRAAIDAGALDAVTARSVLVVVNPSNPTGRHLDGDDIEGLLAWAGDRGVDLVLDETYLEFFPEGVTPSTGLAERAWREHVTVVGTFSKSLAVSGLRIGYVVAPREIVAEVLKVQDTAVVCAPHPAQRAVAETLGAPEIDAWLEEKRQEIGARVTAFSVAAGGTDGPFAVESAGAFFAYLRARNAGAGDTWALAEHVVRSCGVACLPGAVFGAGEADALRVAVGNVDAEVAAEAARRLQELR